ncbi:hypothetical protein IGB42_02495 [Andreprevotia sp. IGB-42]|uniref:hypothetical protein n=1 Tax=Andreprevotia sp. IGB-42 TaxID=2497473 RepID=UPI00135BA6C7|nr:hypothetical protein [Andreprevotia sp. IGB-42]KAF0813095.1 hypothetical protein IGB42_02495 [Andreprevotia sp. IGB-42]
MQLLGKISASLAGQINAQFPHLQRVREHARIEAPRVAISVFDHWLRDPAQWPLLDCNDGPERIARNRKFAAHWAALFDLTAVYTVRNRGRWPHKSRLIIKRYTNRQGFLDQCRFDANPTPSQFVILPEYGCIYAESWDDTNLLYCNDRQAAEPVLQLARDAGLHVLDCEI